jgi:hypothetical protein
MNNRLKLHAIRLIHTLIWIFMVTAIGYVLYSGISNEVNAFTWWAVAIVILEGIVLAAFNMICPLTLLARKYTGSTKENFDIYLPLLLARYNKQIFTPVFILGLIIVLIRVL